jgi:cytoskeletal protein CcmA (bactofilin family)
MVETVKTSPLTPGEPNRTMLGRSLVIKGEISGNEDLVIAGQFEGTLNIQGQCVTVGPEGKVKADIQAARVVIYGTVHGNISVRERVEILKSGHVVGDIVSPGISIEDGAYFKGKIEILREAEPERTPAFAPARTKEVPAPVAEMKAAK